MKKAILLFFSILFLIAFATMIDAKEFIWIIVYGALSGLFFYLWYKERQKSKDNKEINVPIDFTSSCDEVNSKIKKYYLLDAKDKERYDINRQMGIRLLESLAIISNTRNIDTLKNRAEYIMGVYPELIDISSVDRYEYDMNIQIDNYKAHYYDRTLEDDHVILLLKPSEENLKDYIARSVFLWFDRYVAIQQKEFNQLKTETAKKKRIENIYDKGTEALAFLLELGSPYHQQYLNIRNQIEELTDKEVDDLSLYHKKS